MSMYNMMFGVRPDSAKLLALVGLKEADVPRFRDVFVSKHPAGPLIAVYTRMGGGNRGHWESMYPDSEPGPDCKCPGCKANYQLTASEHYVYDQDDDFDTTYATYYYRPPELPEGLELTPEMSGDERWALLFETLGIKQK